MNRAPFGSVATDVNVPLRPIAEAGAAVTDTAVGGVEDGAGYAVHVPMDCQLEGKPARSYAVIKLSCGPMNAGLNVNATVTERLLPDRAALDPPPFRVH